MKDDNEEKYEVLEKVASTFNLLSDANRLLILQQLKQGEYSVNEIVALTGLKQAAVSKHLGMMYNGKLLERRKDGNKSYYKIADSTIFQLCEIVCYKLKQEQSELAEMSFEI